MNRACEVCDAARAVHMHHKKRRSQGRDDSPENLLAVCLKCHNFIHANPAWSYEQGYLIRGSTVD